MNVVEPFQTSIPYKSIIDLVEKKNVLIVTVKGEPPSLTRSPASRRFSKP